MRGGCRGRACRSIVRGSCPVLDPRDPDGALEGVPCGPRGGRERTTDGTAGGRSALRDAASSETGPVSPARPRSTWLGKASLVGCDTLAIDATVSTENPAHYARLGSEVYIVENLKNLDRLPPFCLFLALPLKIKGGSGSPVRAVALVRP